MKWSGPGRKVTPEIRTVYGRYTFKSFMNEVGRNFCERRNQGGQAAIEFIVCIVVIFFFLLFYLSMCILLVTSEYMDYATFMAARTYKSAYGSQETQEANSKIVFDSYTDKISGIARNFSLNYVQLDQNDAQTGGVEASYDIDMFYLPPLFVGDDMPPSKLRLTSEAHLGREPGFQECVDYFTNYIKDIGVADMDQFIEDMDDNGC